MKNEEDNKIKREEAKCRNCGVKMKGCAYYYGNNIYQHKVNHYGGYVCSENCDRQASLDLESSMPGAGRSTRLSSGALSSFNKNWS